MFQRKSTKSRLAAFIDRLIASLSQDMLAFTVQVRGLTYDVYHSRLPLKGTPYSVAVRIRQEDGKPEITTIAKQHLSAREISPKIAEAQRKEFN